MQCLYNAYHMDQKRIRVIKLNGQTEIFDPSKIISSLTRAGAEKGAAEAIVREVESKAYDGMTTADIFAKAFEMLHSAEKRIAARYSVRRAIGELGPTGFPFEKFVADIFKAEGYAVLTDQILKGACAEHEIDVVAYNDAELIAVEVKYHNENGLKSDLKVALYVKARIDDLKEVPLLVAGKERQLTDALLVTNTKFTQSAIGYAMCKNLKLIGWNYPSTEGLEDLIVKYGLYPITCLVSLGMSDKKALLDHGYLLVSDVRDKPDILVECGVDKDRITHIQDEITILFSK